MNAVQKLRQVHGQIAEGKDGVAVADAWTLAGRLLSRMPVDQSRVAEALAQKDAEALDGLIAQLEGKAAAPPPPATRAADPEALKAFAKEDVDAAMRAFKKRLRVMRLADESKLGGRYVSGGKASKIDAIEPPTDYPPEMWRALARAGRLVDTGQGFYRLPG
jgi:hypothetical protein